MSTLPGVDPSSADGVEEMIRATGGVPVQVPDESTWGHVDYVDPDTLSDRFDLPDSGDRRRVVAIPAARLPEPVVGHGIEVDGEAAQVLDYRRPSDGAVLEVVFGSWMHRVDLYRPGESGDLSRGQQQLDFSDGPLHPDVKCDVWAVSGEMIRRTYGEEASGRWTARFPPSVDVLPDDYLHVLSGPRIPKRLHVTFVREVYNRRRVPAVLEETGEAFGDESREDFS